ncbi:MAG: 30S ribosome-binding factor RbfA [Spirochaetia bacterium]|nr:30S ribosome-binding factor RbfA [Spirochaetia bacterium]
MNEIRRRRLESQILRELSGLIMRRRIKDDRLGLVSVTEIKLAPDLSEATAFVSPFGSDKENTTTYRALHETAPFFQSELSRNLRLRQTPKLVFTLDNRIKEGDRILHMMDKDKPPVKESAESVLTKDEPSAAEDNAARPDTGGTQPGARQE